MIGKRLHVAVLLKSLYGGGAERVMLALASAFANQGSRVDVVLASSRGHYYSEIPGNVDIHELAKEGRLRLIFSLLRLATENWRELLALSASKLPRIVKVLPSLEKYLRSVQPDVMLATLPSANIVAAWAV
jgi:glycosyltransferase involved in cell wall biosynthesis